jgi:hypothetical protein
VWIRRDVNFFSQLCYRYACILTSSMGPFKCQVSTVAGALFCFIAHCRTEFSLLDENEISTGTMLSVGENNGKLPLRICPGCSVPEPYRSPDWALVPAETGPRAEY